MILYLDTSSLVKLYTEEDGSAEVRELVAEALRTATSLIAYPEARSALARQRREGRLGAPDHARARRALEQDWPRLDRIALTDALVRHAGELAEAEGLKGSDSIHLASYLELVRRAGGGEVRFSCFDEALDRAARRAVRRFREGS